MVRVRRYAFLLGVWLISACVLMLEVALTRIFSVMMWYHFAFLAISLVLFGFGASASLMSVAARTQEPKWPPARLRGPIGGQAPVSCGMLAAARSARLLVLQSWIPIWKQIRGFLAGDPGAMLLRSSALFAGSVGLCYVGVCHIQLNPAAALHQWPAFGMFVLFFFVLSLPFFFSGVAIAVALSRVGEATGTVYFADLFGAGVGSAAIVVLLNRVGPVGVLQLVTALAVAATLLFSAYSSGSLRPSPRKTLAWLAGAAAVGSLGIWAVAHAHIPLYPGKAIWHYPGTEGERRGYRLESSRWNAISRVDIVNPAPHGEPAEMWVLIDADAFTPIINVQGPEATWAWVQHQVCSLAFQAWAQGAKVCVIGSGGGRDVLAALECGAAGVDAVDINPLITEAVLGPYAAFSGDLYRDPRVRLLVREGRSYLRTTPNGTYSLIQLSMVDTWAATSAGAYSLCENFLYTVEAFREYLRALKPEGVLTLTRWHDIPPRETLRLVSLAVEALLEEGAQDPAAHIAVVTRPPQDTFVCKKSPLSPTDLRLIQDICARQQWHVLYLPTQPKGNSRFHQLLRTRDRAAFYAAYLYDVRPTTDDRPFFFQRDQLRTLWTELFHARAGLSVSSGNVTLLALLLASAGLSLLFILLPLLVGGRRNRPPRHPALWAVYFSALGLGFMFVEVALMQKLGLLLGHPTYSISVVLNALLVGAGLGALASNRIRSPLATTVAVVGLWAALWSGIYIATVVLMRHLDWPLWGRACAAVAALLPVGFVLGLMMPLGLRRVREESPDYAPWAWGVNCVTSVVGSALSLLLAIAVGFTAVLYTALGLYVLAGLLLRAST